MKKYNLVNLRSWSSGGGVFQQWLVAKFAGETRERVFFYGSRAVQLEGWMT